LNQTPANISVIIPAYNRASLIGETLRSLLNQTVPAKEIIVVDDGSTDGTAEVVELIAEEIEDRRSAQLCMVPTSRAKDIGNALHHGARSGEPEALDSRPSPLDAAAVPQIRVIRQQNAGPGAARNRGLAEATGEFIHFFDSDDIAAPNKHEVQLRALLETGADIAYGAWVKGRFAPPMADSGSLRTEEGLEEKAVKLKSETLKNVSTEETKLADTPVSESPNRSAVGPASSALDAGLWSLVSGPWAFEPEGPVLQARGLPEGYLIKALLTNWSIVPHACLFRRSILEKAGGFPEDIWVGEDQLLFLRFLLAGAKVVHSPGTMVYYRVGDDPGKLTATGAAQKRHAKDWARFLLKAKKEIEDRRSKLGTTNHTNLHERGEKVSTTIERQGGRENEQPKVGPKGEGVGTTESNDSDIHGFQKSQQGDAQGTCAGASEPDTLASKLADSPVSESLTRSASGPASLPATSYSPLATAPEALTPPSAWFGFRLRAYEAWRDLGRFFPDGEDELKSELQGIWKRNWFSSFGFQVLGFVFRKLGGLKFRVLGYREHQSFYCHSPLKVSLQRS
jgi:GT2 family glycosyltransferase